MKYCWNYQTISITKVDPELRVAIEEHLRQCHRCSVLLDSTRKMLYFVADERIFEVPVGYSERLHKMLSRHLQA